MMGDTVGGGGAPVSVWLMIKKASVDDFGGLMYDTSYGVITAVYVSAIPMTMSHTKRPCELRGSISRLGRCFLARLRARAVESTSLAKISA